MSRRSAKLHQDFKSLCCTIESLGKRWIPSLSKSVECFNHLFILHQWLLNFCSAAGNDFISNFDYFCTRQDFYKLDSLHQNKKGTKQLFSNFIHFIAFNSLCHTPQHTHLSTLKLHLRKKTCLTTVRILLAFTVIVYFHNGKVLFPLWPATEGPGVQQIISPLV